MRIAVYLPTLCRGKGGAEKVACQVADLLAADGHAVSILYKDIGRPIPFELHPDVGLLPVTVERPIAALKLRGRVDLLIGFAMANHCVGIARMADILDAPFAVQECTNPRRMVASIYMTGQDHCRTLPEAYWLRQAVYARAAAVRLTLDSYVTSIHPRIRPHCHSFPNGFALDPSQASAWHARPNVIVCVGGLKTANKNGLDAAEAFVASGLGRRGWRMEFVGQNTVPDQFDALAEKVPDGALVDRGEIDGATAIYGHARLLVIPSFEEGLPNVVIEAMTFGIPCIGYSDCPGVSDLIENDGNGVLVDRQRPGAMAAALAELADDIAWAHRLSDAATALAAKRFTLDAFEDSWRHLVSCAVVGRDASGRHAAPFALAPGRTASALRAMLDADLPFSQPRSGQ
ncbi:MAG: glycosyltransferase family 4 protein [Paracoccaceae bacterium]